MNKNIAIESRNERKFNAKIINYLKSIGGVNRNGLSGSNGGGDYYLINEGDNVIHCIDACRLPSGYNIITEIPVKEKHMTFAEKLLREIDNAGGMTYTEITQAILNLRHGNIKYDYKIHRGLAQTYMGMIKNFARKQPKTGIYIIWKEIVGPFYPKTNRTSNNYKAAFERMMGNKEEMLNSITPVKDNKPSRIVEKLSLNQLHNVLEMSITFKTTHAWREGQALFNSIAQYYPELSNEIRGNNNIDPFYKDINIKACINYILK